MAAQLKVYYTSSERLPNLPVTNGQLVFVRDTGRIYLDMGDVRTSYNAPLFFDTDEERMDEANPDTGLYYVRETGRLWFYDRDDGWEPVSGEGGNSNVTVTDEDLFPQVGSSKMLYVGTESVYRWGDQGYYSVGKGSWQTL